MKRRRTLFATLLMFLACGMLRAPVMAQTVDLTAHFEPLADLSKEKWRFHPGDDPRWADPSFDDSQWPLLSGDTGWGSQGFKGLSGFGWYRIHVKLQPAQPVTFAPGEVRDSYEVFADGRRIGAWGPRAMDSVPYLPHDSWSIVATVPQHTGEVVLALRVWSWPQVRNFRSGGFTGSPILLGSPQEVDRVVALRKSEALIQNSAECTICLLYILAGCLALMLYIKERRSREYLWFGIFTITASLIPITYFVFNNWIVISKRWSDLIQEPFYDMPHIALMLFFFYFIGRPFPRFVRWLIYIEFGLLLCDCVQSLAYFISYGAWNIIYSVSDAICYAVILWLAFAYWKQSRSARRLAIPLLLLVTANVAQDIGLTTYTLGLTGNFPPILEKPVLFGYVDLAWVLFLGTVAYVLIERFAENQAERTRLTGEFEAARTVQQVLIPDFLPPVAGLMVESAYIPAQEVGGDFFQILPIPGGGDAFIVVGDVSGKGLKAAMTVGLLVGTLRTLAEYVASPAEMLAGLNRRLHGRDAGFATCLVLKITPEGDVTIANAGHPNPYLDGVEVRTDSNLPLGLSLEVSYTEAHLHIDPTQSFTLVTDGVVEATAPATRELFGFDRTQAISRQAAEAIAEAARAFGVGAPQADDITVLTITRTLGPMAVPA